MSVLGAVSTGGEIKDFVDALLADDSTLAVEVLTSLIRQLEEGNEPAHVGRNNDTTFANRDTEAQFVHSELTEDTTKSGVIQNRNGKVTIKTGDTDCEITSHNFRVFDDDGSLVLRFVESGGGVYQVFLPELWNDTIAAPQTANLLIQSNGHLRRIS